MSVVRHERRLRPVDDCYGSASGTAEPQEVGDAVVPGLLEPPLALCGDFGPAGAGAGGSGEGGARRISTAEGAWVGRTEQASHRRVTARRPRSETSSSVTSLLLAPGESAGMGAGKREAPRRGGGFFKAQGWEGPGSGAAPAWCPLAGWL